MAEPLEVFAQYGIAGLTLLVMYMLVRNELRGLREAVDGLRDAVSELRETVRLNNELLKLLVTRRNEKGGGR